ncbi:MAG: electron transfer flavoprotein subunit beta/FixA family protein [Eubacterium sp.]|nr:electron transfer flavoprotein subunit beta/FixA family protein [Eubacterium sp.]
MNIAVCLKQTLDPEIPLKDFKIDPETKKPVQGNAKLVLDSFAENALEVAIQLKEQYGAKVTVITVGADSTVDVLRRGMALTADEAVRVWDDSYADLDAAALVSVLGEALKNAGDFDLILTGRQAADVERGSTGPMLGEYLGRPAVTFVTKVRAVEEGSITVEREIEGAVEVVQSTLPAVLSVTSHESNIPRLPKVRDTMKASRKAIADVGADALADADLAAGIEITDVFVPVMESNCEYIEGDDGAEKAANLASKLRELKLI